jgi:hypothetical protein
MLRIKGYNSVVIGGKEIQQDIRMNITNDEK